jgi:hypothetical protein
MPGNVRQAQDWNDAGFRKEVAENYWKIKTYDTADERRAKRALRKDHDLLRAALRGEENATHPLADEIKELLKAPAQPAAAAEPAQAGSPWAALESAEVKEELEASPVLAKAIATLKAADDARTKQFVKIATDYKALLAKVEAGDGGRQEPLDQAELFALQTDVLNLQRTPHGKALCEKISREVNGVADVRKGAEILAQEFVELITERANKGGPDPDFMKDIVEAEMRSYNISSDAAPAPKPAAPKPTPPPTAGDLPRGGPGASKDEPDDSNLTPEQIRDRARAKFDGKRPVMLDKLGPGGGGILRRRLHDSGFAPPPSR